jgi:hypothetical protein
LYINNIYFENKTKFYWLYLTLAFTHVCGRFLFIYKTFLFVYISCIEGFYCEISIHSYSVPMLDSPPHHSHPPPFLKHFNRFPCSIFIQVYKVYQSEIIRNSVVFPHPYIFFLSTVSVTCSQLRSEHISGIFHLIIHKFKIMCYSE